MQGYSNNYKSCSTVHKLKNVLFLFFLFLFFSPHQIYSTLRFYSPGWEKMQALSWSSAFIPCTCMTQESWAYVARVGTRSYIHSVAHPHHYCMRHRRQLSARHWCSGWALHRLLYCRSWLTALEASMLPPHLKSCHLLGVLAIPARIRTDKTLPCRGCSPNSPFLHLAHIYLLEFRLFSKTKVLVEVTFWVTANLFLASQQVYNSYPKAKIL